MHAVSCPSKDKLMSSTSKLFQLVKCANESFGRNYSSSAVLLLLNDYHSSGDFVPKNLYSTVQHGLAVEAR